MDMLHNPAASYDFGSFVEAGQHCVEDLDTTKIFIEPVTFRMGGDRFNAAYDKYLDEMLGEEESEPVTYGQRLFPGCECGAAASGDFERCRCD